MSAAWSRRAAGVAAGLLLDRVVPEPPDRWHPVAWFGRGMSAAERRCWTDRESAGIAYAALGVGLAAGVGALLDRVDRATPRPVPAGLVLAIVVSCAGPALRHHARAVEDALRAGDLAAARQRLPALVGRDPETLDASGVSAAVVESLAENAVDAVLAPAFWGVAAGAPGVLAYRAVNTLDAMVGHRSPRHARFGWASAKADDVANLLPARTFAALVALARPSRALAVAGLVRRDAPAHPSPNAGVAETAVAAALGRQLGGPLRYGGRPEPRPTLGDGPRPGTDDIARARRLVDDVEWALTGLLLVAALAPHVARRSP